jgi:hypothetical protein
VSIYGVPNWLASYRAKKITRLAFSEYRSEKAFGQSAVKDGAERFSERILSDTAAAMLSLGAYIGDRLGIYQAMMVVGPATSTELAARTRLNERYLEELLALMTRGLRKAIIQELSSGRQKLEPEFLARIGVYRVLNL